VPPNVFLIGTMNTADRSISLIDAALRRRFGFIELMPNSNVLAGRRAGDLMLGPWLDALNQRLRRKLKRDARNLQVGHAYLMPQQPIASVADFGRVLRDDIIPLLEEYCYDDFPLLAEVLGPSLVDVEGERIREEVFASGREADLIQAVSFEEMEPLAAIAELETESGAEGLDESDGDADHAG
jgi:5-methylcytosine-specific restriction protein B